MDEWDREGYEDIRSMGRCGTGISSIAKCNSERAEEGDKGVASDMFISKWSGLRAEWSAKVDAMQDLLD